jgi:hypothetical protein
MNKGKQEVISFKADESLLKAMQGIPNRSEFIRAALLAALDGVCPLCRGTGILTPAQQEHWKSFSLSHGLAECHQCHALHLVCRQQESEALDHEPA